MTLGEANEKRMPGSLAAKKAGCVCPMLENRHGMGWAGIDYQVRPTCPLHGEASKKETTHADA